MKDSLCDKWFDGAMMVLYLPIVFTEKSESRAVRLLGLIAAVAWSMVLIIPVGLPTIVVWVILAVWEESGSRG